MKQVSLLKVPVIITGAECLSFSIQEAVVSGTANGSQTPDNTLTRREILAAVSRQPWQKVQYKT